MAITSMGSAPIISRYVRYLQTRGCSPETIRSARSILHRLAVDAGATDLLLLTSTQLASWQSDRVLRVRARTLRTQVSYVQCFYRWAVKEGLLKTSPAEGGLITPKVPRLLPRPIDEDSLSLAAAEAGAQMRAVLYLAAFCGLRAGEIAGLDWSEVRLRGDEPTARVIGKGSKERIVDLPPTVVRALAQLPGPQRGPVMRRWDGKAGRVTPNALSKAANRHLRRLGISDTLHALRHRSITEVCRLGGIRVAQEFAGHANPSTTSGYAKVSVRDLRAIVVAAGQIQALEG